MSTTLIITMAGLLLVLIVLVFLYIWVSRTRSVKSEPLNSIETFETLYPTILNSDSKNEELWHVCETIMQRYAVIAPNRLDIYLHLIETLCVHPHTESKLIVQFEKGLRSANPRYAKEIEGALSRGLAHRN